MTATATAERRAMLEFYKATGFFRYTIELSTADYFEEWQDCALPSEVEGTFLLHVAAVSMGQAKTLVFKRVRSDGRAAGVIVQQSPQQSTITTTNENAPHV